MEKNKRIKAGIGVICVLIVLLVVLMIRNKGTNVLGYSASQNAVTNETTQTPIVNEDISESETEVNTGVRYVYDNLNRVTKVLYPDGSVITYSYDKNGNMKASKVSAVVTATPEITTTPQITATPHVENVVEVYYYNVHWTNAYIHYKVGNGDWTSIPGKKMSTSTEQSGYTWKYTIDLGTATEAIVCFNNGNGSWDSRNQANYKVYAGKYGIKEEKVTKLQQTIPSPEITTTPHAGNVAEVYYYNANWTNAYIHYKVGNGDWTSIPGKKMSASTEQSGYMWKYTIDLGTATEATVCFNNGNGSWDSRNQADYKVYAGKYGIREEKVTKLQQVILSPQITTTPHVGNVAEVYYYNASWTTAYIHYKVGNGSWTSVPGKKMSASTEQSGYMWKYTIDLGTATEVTVCFNNGNDSWDSRNQANYKLSGAGVYGIKNGVIITLK